jgi:hypothetical protein
MMRNPTTIETANAQHLDDLRRAAKRLGLPRQFGDSTSHARRGPALAAITVLLSILALLLVVQAVLGAGGAR